MAKLVESVYGDALFELALEEGRLDEFSEEAQCILRVLELNPDLTVMMTHPQITKEEKLNVIDSVFSGRVSKETQELLRLLAEKDHFSAAEKVFSYVSDRIKAEKKIGVAYVRTPIELSKAQCDQVEAKLLETTDFQSLEMHYETDPSLIGGMVIRIGDRIVDSSISSRLHRLSRELSEIQLKAGESTP